MDAIKQTFFQECEEQLALLENGLLEIEGGSTDPETVNAVFRAVHSIKGRAGAFALDELVRFAHVFETSLDKLRSDRLTPQPAVLKALLRAADILADLVTGSRDGGFVDPARSLASAAELAALGEPIPVPPATDSDEFDFTPVAIQLPGPAAAGINRWTVRFRPLPALYAKANDAGLLLRGLSRLGSTDVMLDAGGLPDLAALEPEGAYLTWTVSLATTEPLAAIREVFEFVEGDCEIDIAPADAPDSNAVPPGLDVAALLRLVQGEAAKPEAASASPVAAKREGAPVLAKSSIRVDLDRVDRLIDLVGELVINQAMLAQRVLETGLTRSSNVAVGPGRSGTAYP